MSEIHRLEVGTIRQSAGTPVVARYDDESGSREAVGSGVAIANRSHQGLIRLTGGTRLAFLHNMTTSPFNQAHPGQVVDTVFLTATARLIDLVTVLVEEESLLLLTSPERRGTILGWLPRFIFFTDDVAPEDVSDHHALFSLHGPGSGPLVEALGGTLPGAGQHRRSPLGPSAEVRLVDGSALLGPGLRIIVPREEAAPLWTALREGGAWPMGADLWEEMRVTQGRPAPDREITEAYNPLEAGLWQMVSFTKGCFIGQEIVARLDTYQKLKQQLWGLTLDTPVPVGTPVQLDERAVGEVTSSVPTPTGARALAYVRTRAAGAGATVSVGEQQSCLEDLPFLSRGRAEPVS